MISPIYQMQAVSPQIEEAMGAAWRKMAIRENHFPHHKTRNVGVKPEIQAKIVDVLRTYGKSHAALIAERIGEAPFSVSNYLIRMVESGVIARRKAKKHEVPPCTRWIYEMGDL